MAPNPTFLPDADAQRLALEVIATLVNVKKTAAEQVLKPAGVPENLIRRFLTERDPITGDKRSKRESAAVIFQDLAHLGLDQAIIRRLVELAANWDAFHLAQDEYKARAVVQKARELQGKLVEAGLHEKEEYERRKREAAERESRAKDEEIRRESALLLAQFEHANTNEPPQGRGYLLEDILKRLFLVHRITVHEAFRRNGGGEQIDAAFEMDGWHYVVECRWRDKLADIRQLDGLAGQVRRSGRQTMGMFLSINGWSEHVVHLLKQDPEKSIFLMEGYDLRTVLCLQVDFKALLKAKLSALNLRAEPYFSARKLLS